MLRQEIVLQPGKVFLVGLPAHMLPVVGKAGQLECAVALTLPIRHLLVLAAVSPQLISTTEEHIQEEEVVYGGFRMCRVLRVLEKFSEGLVL